MNNLPEVKAPKNPPSLKIQTKTQETIENEDEEEGEQEELPTEQDLTQDPSKLKEYETMIIKAKENTGTTNKKER